MEQITIRDASTGRPVTGKLVKEYPLGITIDDANDIRHYATFDRVISGLKPIDWSKAHNASLF